MRIRLKALACAWIVLLTAFCSTAPTCVANDDGNCVIIPRRLFEGQPEKWETGGWVDLWHDPNPDAPHQPIKTKVHTNQIYEFDLPDGKHIGRFVSDYKAGSIEFEEWKIQDDGSIYRETTKLPISLLRSVVIQLKSQNAASHVWNRVSEIAATAPRISLQDDSRSYFARLKKAALYEIELGGKKQVIRLKDNPEEYAFFKTTDGKIKSISLSDLKDGILSADGFRQKAENLGTNPHLVSKIKFNDEALTFLNWQKQVKVENWESSDGSGFRRTGENILPVILLVTRPIEIKSLIETQTVFYKNTRPPEDPKPNDLVGFKNEKGGFALGVIRSISARVRNMLGFKVTQLNTDSLLRIENIHLGFDQILDASQSHDKNIPFITHLKLPPVVAKQAVRPVAAAPKPEPIKIDQHAQPRHAKEHIVPQFLFDANDRPIPQDIMGDEEGMAVERIGPQQFRVHMKGEPQPEPQPPVPEKAFVHPLANSITSPNIGREFDVQLAVGGKFLGQLVDYRKIHGELFEIEFLSESGSKRLHPSEIASLQILPEKPKPKVDFEDARFRGHTVALAAGDLAMARERARNRINRYIADGLAQYLSIGDDKVARIVDVYSDWKNFKNGVTVLAEVIDIKAAPPTPSTAQILNLDTLKLLKESDRARLYFEAYYRRQYPEGSLQQKIRARFGFLDYLARRGIALNQSRKSWAKELAQEFDRIKPPSEKKSLADYRKINVTKDHVAELHRLSASGVKNFIWLIDRMGNLKIAPQYYDKRGSESSKHIALADAENAFAAGELHIRNGELLFDLQSGTYMKQLSKEEQKEAVLAARDALSWILAPDVLLRIEKSFDF